jgi:hypothetical protein
MTTSADLASAKLLCKRLRSKRMIMNVELEYEVRGSDDGYFWCTHSMNCLGPDGRVADRESCRPGRACHEPR